MVRGMPRVQVSAERRIQYPVARVALELHRPDRYRLWLAGLRALAGEPPSLTAEIGYLSYRHELDFELAWSESLSVTWRGGNDRLRLVIGLRLSAVGTDACVARLWGRAAGEERVVGLALDHALVRLSLQLAAEDSLAALGRLVRERGALGDETVVALDCVDARKRGRGCAG